MKIDIKQLEYIDKKLRDILIWLETSTGLEFTITSQYRMTGEGVHAMLPLRGTDLRIRNKNIGKNLEILVNNHWEYDHKRTNKKCAILHGEGSNLHLHIQTHSNTRLRV